MRFPFDALPFCAFSLKMTEVLGVPNGADSLKRPAKVQELEEKIKLLENENKKLLNKVHSSPSPERLVKDQKAKHNGTSSLDDDSLDNDLINLETTEPFKEDEWLYVSPVLPPTPQQKKITPLQWLSEGRAQKGRGNEDLPTLNDVRKSLIYNIEEAEKLADELYGSIPTRHPDSRQRRAPAREEPATEPVPVTRWKAKVPVDSPSLSEQSEEEQAPPRKWKMRQVPSDSSPQAAIRARPAQTSQQNVPPSLSEQSEEEQAPPRKWKVKQVPSDSSPQAASQARPAQTSQQNVPVDSPSLSEQSEEEQAPPRKWKVRQVPSDSSPQAASRARQAESSEEVGVADEGGPRGLDRSPRHARRQGANTDTQEVSVAKWKKPIMPDSNPVLDLPEDRPRMLDDTSNVTGNESGRKWKAKLPGDTPEDPAMLQRRPKVPENTPSPHGSLGRKKGKLPQTGVGKWKANTPEDQYADVPIVTRNARMLPSVDTSYDSQSRSPPLTPPQLSPTHEAPPPSKPLSRRSSFSDRSRSPSPPSISPQVRRAMGSPILSRRTPSPSRGFNARLSPSASPGMQQKYVANVGTPGSRSFTGMPLSGPGAVAGGQGSRLRTPRSQSTGIVKKSTPMKGLTPPGERKGRRMLPSAPSRSPEGGSSQMYSREQVGRSKDRTPTPNKAQKNRYVRTPQAALPRDTAGDEDDSWLEGCF